MATIQDVARRAGVSTSTVSYALSGRRSISADTKARILTAVAELGYVPNAGARALKTARTAAVAVLAEFPEDEFAPATLQYVLPIAARAREHGYDIMLITDPDGPRALRRVTETGLVDGVVLLGVAHEDARLPVLRDARKPGVLIGVPGSSAGLDVFDLDFAAAARELVDHLYRLGHRKAALLAPAEHVFSRGGAYAWRFRDAAVARADEVGMRLVAAYGEAEPPAAAQAVADLLDAHDDVTALIVHNDAAVAGLATLLRDRGVHVPVDLSVVSVYSGAFGRQFSLSYTSVDTVPDVLGRLAMERLLQRIADPDATGEHVVRLVTPQVVDRGSTGAR